MPNKEYKIEHIEKFGYIVTKLGKNISATKVGKPEITYHGTITYIHKEIFGY